MPVAPVDDKGTVLYYEDTGVPPSAPEDYVTVVIVHGASFHSGIFKRALPYAAANKLRLVPINVRDYPGSTPYSDAELEGLRGPGTEAQAAELAARGVEFASFMSWFIENQGVPPISAAPNAEGFLGGGIVLVGWSAGNLQTIPVLAHADKVAEKTRVLLDKYFRTFIAWAANQTAMGVAAHPGIYSPWRDTTLTLPEQMNGFLPWITSYYTQIDVSPDWDTFEVDLVARKKLDSRKPTIENITPEELAATTDVTSLERSQVPIEFLTPAVYQEVVRRALYDCCSSDSPNPGASEPIWAKTKVRVLYGGMDVGDVVRTAYLFKRDADAARKRGKVAREIEIIRLDGGNHFQHWDEPENFVRLLAGIV